MSSSGRIIEVAVKGIKGQKRSDGVPAEFWDDRA
jgi:hypothetical protein